MKVLQAPVRSLDTGLLLIVWCQKNQLTDLESVPISIARFGEVCQLLTSFQKLRQ